MSDDLHAALSEMTDLDYCIASETIGLGQCQCNSHPSFWRRDGEPLTDADQERFWSVVQRVRHGDAATAARTMRY